MKVALHVNGHLQVELTPESEIETVLLNQMLERAGRGQKVTLERAEGGVTVSMEK